MDVDFLASNSMRLPASKEAVQDMTAAGAVVVIPVWEPVPAAHVGQQKAVDMALGIGTIAFSVSSCTAATHQPL